jgi:hypothetical protein
VEKDTFSVDGWFTEKVIHSLNEVAGAAWYAREIEKLKIGSSLSSEEKRRYELLVDAVNSYLYAALYDLTKVASVLNGERGWEFKDRDEIYERGRLGLASVLAKYGFSDWLASLGLRDVDPSILAQKESVNAVLQRVLELSEGPAENRTLIYIELRKISRDATARLILDLIEPVTQGEKRWAEFQEELRKLLAEI